MDRKSSTAEKVKFFGDLFCGLEEVYGTYDVATGRNMQVKEPVTQQVFYSHLMGRKPYAVYLLKQDKTKAIAVDFDSKEMEVPKAFVEKAKDYQIPAYVERSKSKGYHVWIFGKGEGVSAKKGRLVARFILDQIDAPLAEIFPKHDRLGKYLEYGNCINAPLFGKWVLEGRTVFVDSNFFRVHHDQWQFLSSIKKIDESILDEIIEINEIKDETIQKQESIFSDEPRHTALPPCAIRMLESGVSICQRVSCFRLAVHFNRVGVPYDIALAALRKWALKNTPIDGKTRITNYEIEKQALSAYEKAYSGYGCNTDAVKPFCDPNCPVHSIKDDQNESITSSDTV